MYDLPPSPEPEHGCPVPEQAQESQLPVWGEQEGQPGEGVHRGAVQQGGGQGDLWEPARDGKEIRKSTSLLAGFPVPQTVKKWQEKEVVESKDLQLWAPSSPAWSCPVAAEPVLLD